MGTSYWLHIVAESKLPATYTLALSRAPRNNFTGGAMPTVRQLTWDKASTQLLGVGVQDTELQRAKQELDSEGSYVVAELMLTDSQVKELGFPPAD